MNQRSRPSLDWQIGSKEHRKKALPRQHMDFRFIDLFAGIGGMRLGFEYVGGVCVFSSEWDKSAQATYLANFNEIPHGDITKIHSDDIKDHEILLAGFPCQPFSSIGKREGFLHDTQGTLFDEVKRIIADKKPKAFLLENVKGLTTHDNGNTLRVIRSSLEELGYDLNIKILNSADYGVPQNRERIYIVGFRSDSVSAFSEFLWPAKAKTKKGIGQFIESGVTDRSISKHLQESYIFKLNDGRPERVDQKSNIQVKTLVASYHKIQRLTGTFVQDGPTGLRLFTTEECKAVMGFPKSFKVPVSRTQTFRQFGNSVAVPVIKAIANEIVKVLQSSSN